MTTSLNSRRACASKRKSSNAHLIRQLTSSNVSDVLSDQTVKNLVYIGMAFVNNPELDRYEGKLKPSDEQANGESHEDKYEEAQESEGNNKENQEITVIKSNLQWLFKRMEKISKLGGEKQVDNQMKLINV